MSGTNTPERAQRSNTQNTQSATPLKARGVAMMTVLLITAIVSIIAANVMSNSVQVTNRTQRLVESDRGMLMVWSAENLARIYLSEDARESAFDVADEDWGQGVSLPIDGGLIVGGLTDAAAKYNFNNILTEEGGANTTEVRRVARLFDELAIANNDTGETGLEILAAIVDWMDADSDISVFANQYQGAEDRYYEQQDPPYRAGNRPLVDMSELRLVKGVNEAVYQAITPHLTVLPAYVPVNANTATAPVLRMLDERITREAVAEVMRRQNKEDAFRTVGDLFSILNQFAETDQPLTLGTNAVTVKSDYFRLEVSVQYEGSTTRAASLIRRNSITDIAVISRQYGF